MNTWTCSVSRDDNKATARIIQFDANDGDNITIIRRDRQRCEYRSAYGSVFAWLVLRGLGLDCVGCRPSPGSTASSATSYETQAGRTEAPTARSPVAGTVDAVKPLKTCVTNYEQQYGRNSARPITNQISEIIRDIAGTPSTM